MTTPRLDDLIDGIRTGYPDQPLDQLTAAVLAAEHMSEIADHLIGHFVDQARRSGASWTEIGRCMGVTKQAAQQRFTPKADANMFARFTPRARTAIVRSQEEARAAHLTEIGAAHLLLGLTTDPDSLAMRALAEQGADAAAIRAAAEATVPAGDPDTELPSLIPYDGASKKIIELTVREALRLGHNYVGTEHLLLALLAPESPTSELLGGLGITTEATESYVIAALAELER
ncbi:ATP-dependent Clp protease ATP-binding subunit [Rhodococcus sp. HM1]|uniref:Clp protease N-terminal domain-containing protein n=1 Tax=unclassified Rhodococcus (in: high G+C Gram-positive bacteria) TaxID=192944 RepID=UPI0018CDB337|nr:MULTISPECIES: Clp protease N-terminal domain-containing protein [unclassified Rhodococcus (in: high G+C Gram-positive bacteria)]MBH0118262.1 ATP-dependent Clp protease ATP-binding subunit [Rhodococcus sp. CX]MCK8675052.1 ATP-dependent Clp protease ATP-binding subunit [Rhodococcus sp. HM1]